MILQFPLGPKLWGLFLIPEVLQGEQDFVGKRGPWALSPMPGAIKRGDFDQDLWACAALWVPERTLDHCQKFWLLALALPPEEVTLGGPLLLPRPRCPSLKKDGVALELHPLREMTKFCTYS